MIVVSDTSPLNYLILIGQEGVLPTLFARVIAPTAVLDEMRHPKAPQAVRDWASRPPAWLEIRKPGASSEFESLGPGEAEAISPAQELSADALLIDERDGTIAATRIGLFVVGTLATLQMAAECGLLSLPEAMAALQQTTFRVRAGIIEELLRNDARRKKLL